MDKNIVRQIDTIFGKGELILTSPEHISINLDNCVVNGVPFRGRIYLNYINGNWDLKSYNDCYLRRTDKTSARSYYADHLSDKAITKVKSSIIDLVNKFMNENNDLLNTSSRLNLESDIRNQISKIKDAFAHYQKLNAELDSLRVKYSEMFSEEYPKDFDHYDMIADTNSLNA